MAKDLIDYIKETTDSLLNSKGNEEKRKKALEDLTDFLAEAGQENASPERPDLSKHPSYERLTYEEKSEDELKKLAENTLDGYQNSSVTAIEKDIALLEKQLESEKTSAMTAAENKAESLEHAYGTAKKEVDDDMLRRGLARSSIAVNKNTELSDAKARQAAQISSVLNDTVAALDTEIGALNAQREKALADFNIAYAAKLTEKIIALTETQEKNKAEALKYNNSLAEKEYNANIDAKEKEASIYGKELDNAQKERQLNQTDTNVEQAAYNKMCALLDELNSVDARELVMNHQLFRDNLSDYYYYKLYDRYTR